MTRRAPGWRRSPSIRSLMVVALVAIHAADAAAQEGAVEMEVRARTLASAYENFFRTPDGTWDTILAWTVDGRVTLRSERSPIAEAYVEGGWTRYWTVAERFGLGGGLRIGRRTHVLWLRAGYQDLWPGFSVSDVVRTADIFRAETEYAYHPGAGWELSVDGRLVRVRFKKLPENGSEIYRLGGRLRWRGFGARLSPEVGGGIGAQRADNPELEDLRTDLHARLVLTPVRFLWTSVRYRHRFRRYTGAAETSSNYGRRDDGGQWTAAAAVRVTPHLQIDLHYDQLERDSTRPERAFTTRVVSVGLTLR